ncbi:hypothetical protein GCM10009635_51130 [Actinocatenispora thailandica]
MPGTSVVPAGTAAAASAQPAVESWSVSATTSSPTCPASLINPAGESVPSLAEECTCRSMRMPLILPVRRAPVGTDRRAGTHGAPAQASLPSASDSPSLASTASGSYISSTTRR